VVEEGRFVLVEGFPSPMTDTNCWVLAPGRGEQCVVVDPGAGVEAALDEALARHRLAPVAVLLTHGHFDHTFAVLPVCQARDVPAYIAPADRPQLADPWAGVGLPKGTPMFGRLTWAEPADVRPLTDGQRLDLAGLSLEVAAAPGHTPGSVVFRAPDQLFTGDLLFAGSVGRTDLPGGSTEQLLASLARLVLPLPDETLVRPGHGRDTTVGAERAANPFLRQVA
jgi:glyoxylase-like metal-dependent hydrolase (beta-lactamase superfamily II)